MSIVYVSVCVWIQKCTFFSFCRCYCCSVSYFYAIVSLEYSTGCVMNLKQRAKHTPILSECAMSFLSTFPFPSFFCLFLRFVDAKIYPMPICFCWSIRKLYISIICYVFFWFAFLFSSNSKIVDKWCEFNGPKTERKNQQKTNAFHNNCPNENYFIVIFALIHSNCAPEKLFSVGCFNFSKREKRFESFTDIRLGKMYRSEFFFLFVFCQ